MAAVALARFHKTPSVNMTANGGAIKKRIGVTRAFYDRFTPAIASSDFRLRPAGRGGGGGLDGALDFLAICRV